MPSSAPPLLAPCPPCDPERTVPSCLHPPLTKADCISRCAMRMGFFCCVHFRCRRSVKLQNPLMNYHQRVLFLEEMYEVGTFIRRCGTNRLSEISPSPTSCCSGTTAIIEWSAAPASCPLPIIGRSPTPTCLLPLPPRRPRCGLTCNKKPPMIGGFLLCYSS